jgi:hypothetical protein
VCSGVFERVHSRAPLQGLAGIKNLDSGQVVRDELGGRNMFRPYIEVFCKLNITICAYCCDLHGMISGYSLWGERNITSKSVVFLVWCC